MPSLTELAAPSTWKRVRPYLHGRRWMLLVIGATSILSGFGEATLLYLLLQIATALTADEDVVDLSLGPFSAADVEINQLVAAGLVVLAGLVVIAVIRSVATAAVATGTLNDARKWLFGGFVRSTWEVQSSLPEAHMQTLLANHVQRVGNMSLLLATIITAAFSFVSLMVAAIVLDPLSAGVVLVAVAVCGVALLPLGRLAKRWSKEMMEHQNLYQGLVAQAVRLIREVRVFGVGRSVTAQMERHADRAERLGFRSRILLRLTPQLYQYAAMLLLLLGLAAAAQVDSADLGDLGAIVLLMVRALGYGQQLAGAAQQMADTSPFIHQLEDLRDRYKGNEMTGGDRALDHIDRIEIRDVTFAYNPAVPVLDHVDLTLLHGEALGIVGPSGGGKSTLMQLLLRLRDPDGGAYLLNGHPASEYDLDDFYARFAIVPQENHLIRGDVADNIRFWNPGIPDEDVERAARLAHLHEDVIRFEDGYGTELGPGAQDLSGGQRQRLGLARALTRTPSVLVLDEPTAALDARSEHLVQVTLEELKGSCAIVVVAHRLSTLRLCDKLLVLESGKVTAFGSPDEVLRDSDFFREASRLQLGT